MKTIGLLGGMSWESTLEYYRGLNLAIKAELGGLHSAKIILNSVDFAPIEALQMQQDWQATADILTKAAISIEKAGADFLLICTNTMHIVADIIQQNISIPVLHIADATAYELKKQNIKTVGLLGTKFTMEQDFYKGHLQNNYNFRVLTPNKKDRELVSSIIYQELCLGTINQSSKSEYLRIIKDLSNNGAQGIILGCTEIGMLVKQENTSVKLFDTTQLHINMAIKQALS